MLDLTTKMMRHGFEIQMVQIMMVLIGGLCDKVLVAFHALKYIYIYF